MQAPQSTPPGSKSSVLEGVTVYHWLVVIIASCGWLFDCMDQRLFVLSRESALRELLGSEAAALSAIKTYIGYATTALIVGWATGGIVFGMMSDKMGRVKTMIATLIVYSGFTGLSGLAQGWVDFTIYRFLVGLGVGGMFGAATTLVAESVPGQFRSLALGSLQALSATGNILGSLISLWIPPGAQELLWGFAGWRVLFFVGVLPALLVVPIVFVLREPKSWLQAKADAAAGKAHRSVGSPLELFSNPRWRRNTVVGLLLGVSGMIGLWGIGFFSPELITTALKDSQYSTQDLRKPADIVRTLQSSTNAEIIYLRERLPAEVVTVLEAQDVSQATAVSEETQQALVTGLNTVIGQTNLYNAERFAQVELNQRIQGLITQVQESGDPADSVYLNRQLVEATMPGMLTEIQSFIDGVRGRGTAWQDVGSFFGMVCFTLVASFVSRRLAFLGSFILCMGITMFVFNSLNSAADAYWMLPLMGFAQLAVFAGYSIYFPELFPTRLRGTGVGFCYNTVRYIAAPFPTLMGYLATQMSFRKAAMVMATVYLIGAIALIWAPETKGKSLPED